MSIAQIPPENTEVVRNIFDDESRYQDFKVFTLSYNSLFLHYHDFRKCCKDLGESLGNFSNFITGSYTKEKYLLKIEIICEYLKVHARSNAHDEPLYLCINQIIDEINKQATTWNLETHLLQLRDIGRNLAKEFYNEGGMDLTHITSDYPILLSNYFVTEPPKLPQLACTDKMGIRVSFQKRYKFYEYISYPIVFMHEYVSHIYRPASSCILFSDGWLMYAIECYLRKQMQRNPENIVIKPTQIQNIQDYWYQNWPQGLVKNGYELAREIDQYIIGDEKFLGYTRDIALYPENFKGIQAFHVHFMEIIDKFRSTEGGRRKLKDATLNTETAYDLYKLLKHNEDST